jgi:hypothetical protein
MGEAELEIESRDDNKEDDETEASTVTLEEMGDAELETPLSDASMDDEYRIETEGSYDEDKIEEDSDTTADVVELDASRELGILKGSLFGWAVEDKATDATAIELDNGVEGVDAEITAETDAEVSGFVYDKT